MKIDTIIVAGYLLLIVLISIYSGKKSNKGSVEEFMTGGHHLNWWQTGMTLIAMMFDPGIMGISSLSFVWGFYVVQWNAVNVWITAWFAGIFIIGIYWRSKIITTPEYLEKRFNALTRGFFSLIMTAMLISLLAYAVYMGGVLLNRFLGWNIWFSVAILIGIAGFYVIFGGLKTMLLMDVMQGILLLATLFAVGIMGFVLLEGFEGIKELTLTGKAGTPLNSLVPPMQFNLDSETYYPFPGIVSFAAIAGLSWIICNFSMAQRLLAAKSEAHAQKSLIMAGMFNVFVMLLAYGVGVAARKLIAEGALPDTAPDEAFIAILLNYFPVGVKGVLIVGLIAALLSTIDGLIASSGSLLTQDIYKRFIKKGSSPKHLKSITKMVQIAIIGGVFLIIPSFLNNNNEAGGKPAYELIQEFLGNIFGVLIAIYLLGIFFKRTTAKASFIAMIIGVIVGFTMQLTTNYNFAFIGTVQFLLVMILAIIFSRFEKPKSDQELENLTLWTVPGLKGPFIGLHAWPGLKYWAIGLPIGWFVISFIWEWYMKS
ncbi:MAG: sodium/solute symporter [Bacteroidetes bacterium]|jgi:SSS family solute:Na+ symporter|nr:sodium/solute symporter [Bacteroidota bacterium]